MDHRLPLRVTLASAPAGVRYCLQRGKGELIGPQLGAGKDLHFDLEVSARLQPDGSLRLAGPYAQGPPDGRFVYLCVGQMAGQADSPWSRRIKVTLRGISAELAGLGQAASTGSSRPAQQDPGANLPRLCARINGTGKDGTPACASVPLLGTGWQRG